MRMVIFASHPLGKKEKKQQSNAVATMVKSMEAIKEWKYQLKSLDLLQLLRFAKKLQQ